MRVLLLATRHLGVGGAETYGRLFARALVDLGCTVEVLSLLDGEAASRASPERYLGHQGHRSNLWTHLRLAGDAVRRAPRYDLVVCTHAALGPVALVINGLLRRRYLVVTHGIEVWGRVEPPQRIALRRATACVAVSQFTAGKLASVQGVRQDRISVVHPCVAPELMAQACAAAPETDSGEPAGVTFLTVARLSGQERYKGCDTVIHALPVVRREVGPVRYQIVGEGEDRSRLQQLARDLGVEAQVTFVGPVGPLSLADYYRSCDVFVMPSVYREDPHNRAGEGFGIVYIEAAAFGRPVIAGVGGGATETVRDGETGLVVDGSRPEAVAAAMVRLAGDAEARQRMGRAGRRWVLEQFTYERFCARVGEAVRPILREATRR